MRSFSISHSARGIASAILAAATLSSAACSDETTAPQATAKPIVQSEAIINPIFFTVATVKVVDVFASAIVSEKPTVRFKVGDDSVDVEDNSAKDMDATLGTIKTVVARGASYQVCALKTPIRFVGVAGFPNYPNCAQASGPASQVDFGKVFMRKKPRVYFDLQDMKGNWITGAHVGITYPNGGGFVLDLYEGKPGYDSVIDGKLFMTLAADPKPYMWCETAAPNGYQFTQPTCVTWMVNWDVDYAYLLQHAPIAIKLPG
jgi:hypothetical protein